MRKVWAIIAIVAALGLPSFAAAMAIPPAEEGAAHVLAQGKPADPGACRPIVVPGTPPEPPCAP